MKRKNMTRNALVTSIISLLLCVSMLVGTTFAWFTDSVVSGNNVIAAGNLDIALYNDGNEVTSSTNLFENVLWEPGVVIYENFTIENKGNLALLYDFAINWGEYNQMTEGGYNLTQILKVAMVDEHVSGNREAVIAKGENKWAPLNSWSFSGEMTTEGETKDFALIIYWEPSDNDNNWNVQNGKTTSDGKPLYVNLGINLQATQKMHESDSFGPDYDGLASDWDGSVGEVPEEDEDGVITITTGAELAAFAAEVNGGNSYSGKTVVLGADIDLDNKAWTPIGAVNSAAYFQGTFDGQNHTIYNLSVDKSTDPSEHSTAGLFGWVDAAKATVKNVNINGATVKGSHWVGVIAGYFTGTIENCSVNKATVIGYNVNSEANGDKIGGIVGCLNEHSYINGNTVSNSTITGNRDIGGIAGSVAASTYEMKNNKVTNVTINYATSKDYASAGEIVSGRTGYVADNTNVATNVTIVKSVVVSTADELAAALKSTDKYIAVTLANDIDVPMSSLGQQTGGSGEYKLAGENTETVTVDLNNHKLTLTTGYMTAIGAKNADATITIKNGSMNGTGNSATTWNINDLIFANCNYVFEDVTFDKEVALTNTGKTTTMKKVTINGTGDYYALWISARGQTVEIDGLTVNTPGRGVKIDEQYVDAANVAKVALNVSNADFNTVKKGAIMVKSAAGANITLSKVNIEDTIDPVHAVWVDEDSKDSYDIVTVTGGEKIYEGDVVSSSEGLTSAVAAGKTDVYLSAGIYTVPTNLKAGQEVTISGSAKTVIDINGLVYPSGNAVTMHFDGVTIKGRGYTNGLANTTATYTNCTFDTADMYLYRSTKFINCTFNDTGTYALWTWGAGTVEFEGCTFNTTGKALYVNANVLDNGTTHQTVKITDCKFYDTGDNDTKKAAIETGDDYNKTTYDIIITNTTVEGFAVTEDKTSSFNYGGTNFGTNVWGNKYLMGTDKLNVVIDGVDVH